MGISIFSIGKRNVWKTDMKKITWIKLHIDILHNPKIKILRKQKNGNAYALIWNQFLLIAGESNQDGLLLVSQNVPYTDKALAYRLDWSLNIMKKAIIEFEKYKMIEIFDGVICIANWEKYQSTKKMAKIREDNAALQKTKRLKEKIAKAS